jgi:hypothetical protein
MTQSAAASGPVANPVTVTVNNLVPNPDPVTISSNGSVMFVNQSAPCALELYAPGGSSPIVSIVLPTSSPVTLQANWGQTGSCPYNLFVPGNPAPPTGGHQIIISVGTGGEAKQRDEAA